MPFAIYVWKCACAIEYTGAWRFAAITASSVCVSAVRTVALLSLRLFEIAVHSTQVAATSRRPILIATREISARRSRAVMGMRRDRAMTSASYCALIDCHVSPPLSLSREEEDEEEDEEAAAAVSCDEDEEEERDGVLAVEVAAALVFAGAVTKAVAFDNEAIMLCTGAYPSFVIASINVAEGSSTRPDRTFWMATTTAACGTISSTIRAGLLEEEEEVKVEREVVEEAEDEEGVVTVDRGSFVRDRSPALPLDDADPREEVDNNDDDGDDAEEEREDEDAEEEEEEEDESTDDSPTRKPVSASSASSALGAFLLV